VFAGVGCGPQSSLGSSCVVAILPRVGIYFQAEKRVRIQAVQKIREICASAESIAETMSALRGRKAEAQKTYEAERYQAAVRCALELAKQISDDAMRDVSVSQIIALSVKAGHLRTARVLLRAIWSEKTQAELVANHPPLAV
jgi:hypothetical protein